MPTCFGASVQPLPPPGRLFGQAYTSERASGAIVTADRGLRRALAEVTAATFGGDSGNYHLLKAEAAWFGGDSSTRLAQADSARRWIETAVRAAPRDGLLLWQLGVAYSQLGHHEEAVKIGRRAVSLLPVSSNADQAPFVLIKLAQSYMRAGQADSAVTLLGPLLSIPSELSQAALRADPTWVPLHEHPRFRKLVGTASSLIN